jgi:dihydrofolate reductase
LIISLIVAMDQQRGIGRLGGLPWHLSTDLKRFKALTMGHHLILGRKTHESIGRPLPGRVCIVLSRAPDYRPDGCQVARSLEQALEMARQAGESEAFVIGGGQIFAQALDVAERIYLTRVHAVTDCDTFFPAFDEGRWQTMERRDYPAGENDQFSSTFEVLHRFS